LGPRVFINSGFQFFLDKNTIFAKISFSEYVRDEATIVDTTIGSLRIPRL
jgi:hypothetical protein